CARRAYSTNYTMDFW
nr:immunoglobulin heavy chain junction region [Mus musculus]MBK4187424.1 immunoglobulin heavy chain junction region [Mus musculus]